MVLVFESLGLLNAEEVNDLLEDCDKLSRKITNFRRGLGS